MEIRTSTRGSGISKSFVAVCAVVATMGLGVTAGVVAKNLSAPAAAPAHILQGNLARLGPAYHQVDTRGVVKAAAAVGPDDRVTTTVPAADIALQYDTRGIIPAEAFAPTAQLAPNSFLGPDAQERNLLLGLTVRTTKPHGTI